MHQTLEENNSIIKEYTHTYFLSPAESNPMQRMPITLLLARLIEVATIHANMLKIGFADLAKHNLSWVLARVAIEMKRYPHVNEHYTIGTWVETFNTHGSERSFEILDSSGRAMGYARSTWVAINKTTRQAGVLTSEIDPELFINDKECPIARPERLRPIADIDADINEYRFKYSDIDFNRHVNSCKYVELLLNQWSLDFHDNHRLERFEIAYTREAYFDDKVRVKISKGGLDYTAELVDDVETYCRARLVFVPEHYLNII